MDVVGEFLSNIVVFDTGLTKVRLGAPHDGGYVVLRELCPLASEVYSFGVGDDVSFELDFVGRWPHAHAYLFDPTVDALPVRHPNLHFVRSGISRGCVPPMDPARDSVLKMDIESDEWDVLLHELPVTALLNYSQVVVEFHVVHVQPRDGLYPYWQLFYGRALGRINEELFTKYLFVVSRLNALFRCFHLHANNSLPPITVGGHKFPPLLEASFARKDLVRDAATYRGPLPVPGLDAPNKTDRPDITDYYPMGVSDSAETSG